MRGATRNILIALALLSAAAAQSTSPVQPEMLDAMRWRSIGPAVFGGRVSDVAGIAGEPFTFYVAHSSGGLFKTSNGGVTFESVFDHEGTLSIGAIAIAPDDANTVYVGTGEGKPRNSASFGDGLYKSTDGGKSWRNVGLRATERFARIAIDPQHPRTIFAAAMGHEWGANQERGVFRSTDAGETWKRVLFTNDTSGASDVAIDPQHPRVIFAGMYDYLRQPWHLRSGGPGSGVFRSTDGGETWTRLNDPKLDNGLPKGTVGRVGLAIAASNPKVVYAMIETSEPGRLWRSSDGGDHWTMVSDRPEINARGFYFTNVRVDPADENRVYALSGALLVSTDGGRNFKPIGRSIHGDHHALWIDPKNPKRLLNGSDGGFHLSNDGGVTWDFINSLPLAQMYHVHYDMDEPYHIYGGFQDNELWRGASSVWNQTGVLNADWNRIIGWGDGMHAIPDPRDSNTIYLIAHYGDVSRIDWRTGERRFLTPYPIIEFGSPASAHPYRFNWNSPLTLSASNPDVIYLGANVLFSSHDRGETWKQISPDLTTNDPEKMKISGDPLPPDMTIAEYHCTITAISDNPLDPRVIWAGTDDGNLQLTRDGGRSWTNVNRFPGVGANAWVQSVLASPHDAATAFVALDRHEVDDFAPYAFVTHDYGKTWSSIASGLRGYVHIVRQDRREPNLLYAGTELGVFASFDGGRSWTDLRLGLPPLPVYDLDVHPRDNDLIIGTHARGAFIMDDVTPLQALAHALPGAPTVFAPIAPVRHYDRPERGAQGDRVLQPSRKPSGAIISYFVPAAYGGKNVRIEIVDSARKLVRAFEAPAKPGLNRLVWNLTEDLSTTSVPAASEQRRAPGEGYLWFGLSDTRARVLPGRYSVRLVAGAAGSEQAFTVKPDPRRPISQPDLIAQHDALARLAEMQVHVKRLQSEIGALREKLASLPVQSLPAATREQAARIDAQLKEISDRLLNTQGEYRAPAQLRENIMQVFHMIESYDGAPTKAQLDAAAKFGGEVDQLAGQVANLSGSELTKLNAELRAANLAPITIAH